MNSGNHSHRISSVILLIMGIALILPGVRLLTLGGSPYYVIAGAALILSGWLLWFHRVSGLWIYLGLCAATLVWALWESGLDGWALLPRLWVFLLIAFVILLIWRQLVPKQLTWIASIIVLALITAVFLHTPTTGKRLSEVTSDSGAKVSDIIDWPYVGGNADSQRFSPLQQITPDNVSQLEVAWTTRLGMPPEGIDGVLEVTPLKIEDTLYLCNSMHVVVALDPETGNQRWRFDPKSDLDGVILAACRGVAYYKVPGMSGLCSERIITFARFARMLALDAHTGNPCTDFGVNGEVDLLEGMGHVEKGYYWHNTAATIVRGNIVVGSHVLDGQELNEPSGVIRGFDAVTGEFVWAWDVGRPGEHGLPPEGEIYTPGTPNSWMPMAGDEQLGLVYVPMGNATPDFIAAHRTPEMNKYSSSVVALDAETGELRWSFQTTHRDVWDYEVAPPTLVEFPTDQGIKPALIQPSKRGQFFVLDRRSGKSLVQIEERPVPQGTVPGEKVAPTQPYSTGMPSITQPLNESDMWGLTPFDQLWCRIKFKQAYYEGDFTPIIDRPTIIYPGYLGGINWYGVSVDPERQLLFVNVNHFAMRNWLVQREETDQLNVRPMRVGSAPFVMDHWPQAGTPYSTKTSGFLSPLEVPCMKPPYHEIAAIDLRTRQTVWRQPLGTGRDTGPFGIPSLLPVTMGVPALGGTLVTRSGLLFIAATQERSFRAFDSRTGRLLWQDRIPAGGHANPMTYYSAKSGRQFVLIPASGHPLMKNNSADFLIAYALPEEVVSTTVQ